ncbi:hypothetical protein KIPB_002812 [Kipferlia bialata]|uniref:BEACH domain-containing protein n=1 Tax=Kipferlia bialata TaxID=797122 RepID=A0A9K3GF96_9EUKA|nr:hypothetical protein KIPB_002812 [Kipferlia bialata]|eukprot:g2812.t1
MPYLIGCTHQALRVFVQDSLSTSAVHGSHNPLSKWTSLHRWSVHQTDPAGEASATDWNPFYPLRATSIPSVSRVVSSTNSLPHLARMLTLSWDGLSSCHMSDRAEGTTCLLSLAGLLEVVSVGVGGATSKVITELAGGFASMCVPPPTSPEAMLYMMGRGRKGRKRQPSVDKLVRVRGYSLLSAGAHSAYVSMFSKTSTAKGGGAALFTVPPNAPLAQDLTERVKQTDTTLMPHSIVARALRVALSLSPAGGEGGMCKALTTRSAAALLVEGVEWEDDTATDGGEEEEGSEAERERERDIQVAEELDSCGTRTIVRHFNVGSKKERERERETMQKKAATAKRNAGPVSVDRDIVLFLDTLLAAVLDSPTSVRGRWALSTLSELSLSPVLGGDALAKLGAMLAMPEHPHKGSEGVAGADLKAAAVRVLSLLLTRPAHISETQLAVLGNAIVVSVQFCPYETVSGVLDALMGLVDYTSPAMAEMCLMVLYQAMQRETLRHEIAGRVWQAVARLVKQEERVVALALSRRGRPLLDLVLLAASSDHLHSSLTMSPELCFRVCDTVHSQRPEGEGEEGATLSHAETALVVLLTRIQSRSVGSTSQLAKELLAAYSRHPCAPCLAVLSHVLPGYIQPSLHASVASLCTDMWTAGDTDMGVAYSMLVRSVVTGVAAPLEHIPSSLSLSEGSVGVSPSEASAIFAEHYSSVLADRAQHLLRGGAGRTMILTLGVPTPAKGAKPQEEPATVSRAHPSTIARYVMALAGQAGVAFALPAAVSMLFSLFDLPAVPLMGPQEATSREADEHGDVSWLRSVTAAAKIPENRHHIAEHLLERILVDGRYVLLRNEWFPRTFAALSPLLTWILPCGSERALQKVSLLLADPALHSCPVSCSRLMGLMAEAQQTAYMQYPGIPLHSGWHGSAAWRGLTSYTLGAWVSVSALSPQSRRERVRLGPLFSLARGSKGEAFVSYDLVCDMGRLTVAAGGASFPWPFEAASLTAPSADCVSDPVVKTLKGGQGVPATGAVHVMLTHTATGKKADSLGMSAGSVKVYFNGALVGEGDVPFPIAALRSRERSGSGGDVPVDVRIGPLSHTSMHSFTCVPHSVTDESLAALALCGPSLSRTHAPLAREPLTVGPDLLGLSPSPTQLENDSTTYAIQETLVQLGTKKPSSGSGHTVTDDSCVFNGNSNGGSLTIYAHDAASPFPLARPALTDHQLRLLTPQVVSVGLGMIRNKVSHFCCDTVSMDTEGRRYLVQTMADINAKCNTELLSGMLGGERDASEIVDSNISSMNTSAQTVMYLTCMGGEVHTTVPAARLRIHPSSILVALSCAPIECVLPAVRLSLSQLSLSSGPGVHMVMHALRQQAASNLTRLPGDVIRALSDHCLRPLSPCRSSNQVMPDTEAISSYIMCGLLDMEAGVPTESADGQPLGDLMCPRTSTLRAIVDVLSLVPSSARDADFTSYGSSRAVSTLLDAGLVHTLLRILLASDSTTCRSLSLQILEMVLILAPRPEILRLLLGAICGSVTERDGERGPTELQRVGKEREQGDKIVTGKVSVAAAENGQPASLSPPSLSPSLPDSPESDAPFFPVDYVPVFKHMDALPPLLLALICRVVDAHLRLAQLSSARQHSGGPKHSLMRLKKKHPRSQAAAESNVYSYVCTEGISLEESFTATLHGLEVRFEDLGPFVSAVDAAPMHQTHTDALYAAYTQNIAAKSRKNLVLTPLATVLDVFEPGVISTLLSAPWVCRVTSCLLTHMVTVHTLHRMPVVPPTSTDTTLCGTMVSTLDAVLPNHASFPPLLDSVFAWLLGLPLPTLCRCMGGIPDGDVDSNGEVAAPAVAADSLTLTKHSVELLPDTLDMAFAPALQVMWSVLTSLASESSCSILGTDLLKGCVSVLSTITKRPCPLSESLTNMDLSAALYAGRLVAEARPVGSEASEGSVKHAYPTHPTLAYTDLPYPRGLMLGLVAVINARFIGLDAEHRDSPDIEFLSSHIKDRQHSQDPISRNCIRMILRFIKGSLSTQSDSGGVTSFDSLHLRAAIGLLYSSAPKGLGSMGSLSQGATATGPQSTMKAHTTTTSGDLDRVVTSASMMRNRLRNEDRVSLDAERMAVAKALHRDTLLTFIRSVGFFKGTRSRTTSLEPSSGSTSLQNSVLKQTPPGSPVSQGAVVAGMVASGTYSMDAVGVLSCAVADAVAEKVIQHDHPVVVDVFTTLSSFLTDAPSSVLEDGKNDTGIRYVLNSLFRYMTIALLRETNAVKPDFALVSTVCDSFRPIWSAILYGSRRDLIRVSQPMDLEAFEELCRSSSVVALETSLPTQQLEHRRRFSMFMHFCESLFAKDAPQALLATLVSLCRVGIIAQPYAAALMAHPTAPAEHGRDYKFCERHPVCRALAVILSDPSAFIEDTQHIKALKSLKRDLNADLDALVQRETRSMSMRVQHRNTVSCSIRERLAESVTESSRGPAESTETLVRVAEFALLRAHMSHRTIRSAAESLYFETLRASTQYGAILGMPFGPETRFERAALEMPDRTKPLMVPNVRFWVDYKPSCSEGVSQGGRLTDTWRDSMVQRDNNSDTGSLGRESYPNTPRARVDGIPPPSHAWASSYVGYGTTADRLSGSLSHLVERAPAMRHSMLSISDLIPGDSLLRAYPVAALSGELQKVDGLLLLTETQVLFLPGIRTAEHTIRYTFTAPSTESDPLSDMALPASLTTPSLHCVCGDIDDGALSQGAPSVDGVTPAGASLALGALLAASQIVEYTHPETGRVMSTPDRPGYSSLHAGSAFGPMAPALVCGVGARQRHIGRKTVYDACQHTAGVLSSSSLILPLEHLPEGVTELHQLEDKVMNGTSPFGEIAPLLAPDRWLSIADVMSSAVSIPYSAITAVHRKRSSGHRPTALEIFSRDGRTLLLSFLDDCNSVRARLRIARRAQLERESERRTASTETPVITPPSDSVNSARRGIVSSPAGSGVPSERSSSTLSDHALSPAGSEASAPAPTPILPPFTICPLPKNIPAPALREDALLFLGLQLQRCCSEAALLSPGARDVTPSQESIAAAAQLSGVELPRQSRFMRKRGESDRERLVRVMSEEYRDSPFADDSATRQCLGVMGLGMRSDPLSVLAQTPFLLSTTRPSGPEKGVLARQALLLGLAWQNGALSTFRYLSSLNTLAGRTPNDLTQYPVFPWLISDGDPDTQTDYEGLTSYLKACAYEPDMRRETHTLRELRKPIGAIGEERAERFRERFREAEGMDPDMRPFHYGTHYSSSGVVIHFLVRMEPFTRQMVRLQSGKFDHPDRMFHDMARSYLTASSKHMADVKELTPEFFYQPSLFQNTNGFTFGERSDNVDVDGVVLPPWASSPDECVRVMRAVLESGAASREIGSWVDLIFGCKQQGPSAEEALNVFYWLTYKNAVDVEGITDPMLKLATIAQIDSFGITPGQILTRPHMTRIRCTPPLYPYSVAGRPKKLRVVASVRVEGYTLGSVCLTSPSPRTGIATAQAAYVSGAEAKHRTLLEDVASYSVGVAPEGGASAVDTLTGRGYIVPALPGTGLVIAEPSSITLGAVHSIPEGESSRDSRTPRRGRTTPTKTAEYSPASVQYIPSTFPDPVSTLVYHDNTLYAGSVSGSVYAVRLYGKGYHEMESMCAVGIGVRQKRRKKEIDASASLAKATMRIDAPVEQKDSSDNKECKAALMLRSGFTASDPLGLSPSELPPYTPSTPVLIHGSTSPITCVQPLPQMGILCIGDSAGTVHVLSLVSHRVLRNLSPASYSPVLGIDALSPHGDIVILHRDTLAIQSLSGACIAAVHLRHDAVCMCTTPTPEWVTARVIVTGHANGMCNLWRLGHASSQPDSEQTSPYPSSPMGALRSLRHRGIPRSPLSPSTGYYASGSQSPASPLPMTVSPAQWSETCSHMVASDSVPMLDRTGSGLYRQDSSYLTSSSLSLHGERERASPRSETGRLPRGSFMASSGTKLATFGRSYLASPLAKPSPLHHTLRLQSGGESMTYDTDESTHVGARSGLDSEATSGYTETDTRCDMSMDTRDMHTMDMSSVQAGSGIVMTGGHSAVSPGDSVTDISRGVSPCESPSTIRLGVTGLGDTITDSSALDASLYRNMERDREGERLRERRGGMMGRPKPEVMSMFGGSGAASPTGLPPETTGQAILLAHTIRLGYNTPVNCVYVPRHMPGLLVTGCAGVVSVLTVPLDAGPDPELPLVDAGIV